MPLWIKVAAAVVGIAGLGAIIGLAVWAEFERSGRIPGLLGILVLIVYWAVRRSSTEPRNRRAPSDQKNWLDKERWRR